MNIQKPIINWRGNLTPLNRSNIDGISIHHTDHPSWDFFQTHNFHRNTRRWLGIAYGWFVEKDGTVIAGREFNMNAGVLGHNNHLLSICFAGDYDNQTMPEAQFKAGVELLKWLKLQVTTVKKIGGHKEWQSTSCPGRNFPLQKMINESNNSSSPINSIPVLRQGDNGDLVKELQNKLIELGYWLGTWGADGDFGNATDIAVKKFQEDNSLKIDGIVGNQTWTKLDELIEEKNKPKEEPEPVKQNIPEYKLEGVNYLLEKGFLDDEKWINLLDEKADNWMVFLVLKRIHEDTKN